MTTGVRNTLSVCRSGRHEKGPGRCKECKREAKARHSKAQAEHISIRNRRNHLRRTFGITVEQYEEMVNGQGGECRICHKTPKEKQRLHIDHDHETGRIRGLLCFNCNTALGWYETNTAAIAAHLREADL